MASSRSSPRPHDGGVSWSRPIDIARADDIREPIPGWPRRAGITGAPLPCLPRKAVIVMAADHGASPTFLGTSPSGLRQTAIRCLVQLGVDGLELAAQTRLQLAAVQEYQFAFGQQLGSEGEIGGNGLGSGEVHGDR